MLATRNYTLLNSNFARRYQGNYSTSRSYGAYINEAFTTTAACVPQRPVQRIAVSHRELPQSGCSAELTWRKSLLAIPLRGGLRRQDFPSKRKLCMRPLRSLSPVQLLGPFSRGSGSTKAIARKAAGSTGHRPLLCYDWLP